MSACDCVCACLYLLKCGCMSVIENGTDAVQREVVTTRTHTCAHNVLENCAATKLENRKAFCIYSWRYSNRLSAAYAFDKVKKARICVSNPYTSILRDAKARQPNTEHFRYTRKEDWGWLNTWQYTTTHTCHRYGSTEKKKIKAPPKHQLIIHAFTAMDMNDEATWNT